MILYFISNPVSFPAVFLELWMKCRKTEEETLGFKKYHLYRTGIVIQHSSWNKNWISEIGNRWYGICKKRLWFILGPLVAQTVKNLPAVQETWVWSLGQEDPLEKETPVFLPGEFYGQKSLVGYSPWSHKESDMADHASLTHSTTTELLAYIALVK